MHGQHSEGRQHMWSAPTQRPTIGSVADSTACKSFFKGGRKFSIGDCSLFQAGNAPPFIGILRKVTSDKEGSSIRLGVNWLYRPADVKLAKGVPLDAAPNEIFYSFHKDDISAASLLHPCRVAFLRKGVDLPSGVSSFVCRRVYDTANKCLWWLTDRDYTDEHQEEVDQLLDRTKLEMQAVVQSGGPSPRALAGPTSSQPLKSNSEVVQNAPYTTPSKGKKRERSDQNLEPSKRERSLKSDDGESSPLKRDRSMKPEEIASITDKDGGLLNPAGVERLVQLMHQDRNDGVRKASDVASRRAMLAGVVASTEREDCLNRFVQLGGLPMLDDWLQEAHKGKVGDGGSPKEGDKGVEELLLTLLRALDKLPVDLDALKTCIVGKSVNHLRSHKNLEIQKKARKLVDIWKKRVDAEMKQSGEVKQSGGISWSYKQSSPDSGHPHLMKSGGSAEVVVKSSGAYAGSAKAVPNGTNSGEGVSNKSVGVSTGKSGIVATVSTTSSVKESCLKVPSVSVATDIPVKEEKSSSSGQSQNNGQSWQGGQQAKSVVSSTWKEDVKTSLASPNTSKTGGSSSRHTSSSGKGLLASNLTGGAKEVLTGKPLVWSRTASTEKIHVEKVHSEKVSSPTVATPVTVPEKASGEGSRDSGNSSQRLIVRLPNPGWSPARISGGNYDQVAQSQRGMPLNGQDRNSPPRVEMDSKNRMQNGVTSPDSSIDVRMNSGGRHGSVPEEDREKFANPAPVECLADSDKSGEEFMQLDAEPLSKEVEGTVGNSGSSSMYRQRSTAGEQVTEGDTVKIELSLVGTGSSVEGVVSTASTVVADDQGISLLASVAASEISRVGASAQASDRIQSEENIGEQDVAVRSSSDTGAPLARETSENVLVGQADTDGKDQTDLFTSKAVMSSMPSKVREEGSEEQESEVALGKVVDRDSSKRDMSQDLRSASTDIEPKEDWAGEGNAQASHELGRSTDAINGRSGNIMPSSGQTLTETLNDETDSKVVPPVEQFKKEINVFVGVPENAGTSQELHGSKSWKEGSDEKCQLLGKATKAVIDSLGGFMSNSGVLDSKLGNSDVLVEDPKTSIPDTSQMSYGRRVVDMDAHKMSDIVSGFPGEDVLDVARQAAQEVEQMERYGQSVSMGTDKDVLDVKSPRGRNPADPVEMVISDQGRDWKPTSIVDDKSKEDVGHGRTSFHLSECQDTSSDYVEQSATVSVEIETEDQGRCAGGPSERKVLLSSAVGEETSDAVQDLKRRVGMDVRVLSRGLSFRAAPSSALSSLTSASLPPVNSIAVKHVTRALPAGEPTTPEQATETSGLSDGVVGGSDASERPDFDLNENFAAEDSPQDESTPVVSVPLATSIVSAPIALSSGLAAPIAVVATTKGAFVLPASPLRSKGELGWKGSAATSAFRPAEPRRTPERQPSAGETIVQDMSLGLSAKKVRPPLDIDLNIADDRGLDDTAVGTNFSWQGSVPLSTTASSQGLPLGLRNQALSLNFRSLSSVVLGSDNHTAQLTPSCSQTAARPVLDLNQIDESEESGTFLEADSRVTETMSTVTQSNSTTAAVSMRRVMRDFDLNDGPVSEDVLGDEQPVLQPVNIRHTAPPVLSAVQSLRMGTEVVNVVPWFSGNNNFQAVSVPTLSSSRAEPPYSAAAAAAQSYMSAVTVPTPFNTADLYRASVGLPSAPAAIFSSSTPAYPYAGFPVTANFPFASASSYAANNAASYIESAGPPSFPAPSTGALPASYMRPYMMGIAEVGAADNSANSWAVRPSLDLNAGPEAGDTGSRDDGLNARQPANLLGQSNLEQLRVLRQVASSGGGGSGVPLKRKEPESGWDLYRGSAYKHSTWR